MSSKRYHRSITSASVSLPECVIKTPTSIEYEVTKQGFPLSSLKCSTSTRTLHCGSIRSSSSICQSSIKSTSLQIKESTKQSIMSLLSFELFLKSQHAAKISMKSVSHGLYAIKNSPDGVPEGKPTILAASMCNEGRVSRY